MEEVLGSETIKQLIEAGGMKTRFEGPDEVTTYEIEGVRFPTHLVAPSTIEAMKTWQARSDDVFILSYAKAGTTWTQEIVSAICNNGDLVQVNKIHSEYRVPFLEATMFTSTKDIDVPPTHEIINKMRASSPRVIKSHLPGHLLPPDVIRKKSRIVYVARNPKDVAVSYYHFHNFNPSMPAYATWDEFFEDFHSGNITFGPWWKHYLDYWNLACEPNVLFIKFEDMKKDLKSIVQKTAKFLGYTFTDDVIDSIVHHCTFDNMKENPMTNPDTLYNAYKRLTEETVPNVLKENETNGTENSEKASFMRKGRVGDWKNHFSKVQNEAMDTLIREKLGESGLQFDY